LAQEEKKKSTIRSAKVIQGAIVGRMARKNWKLAGIAAEEAKLLERKRAARRIYATMKSTKVPFHHAPASVPVCCSTFSICSYNPPSLSLSLSLSQSMLLYVCRIVSTSALYIRCNSSKKWNKP